MAGTFDVAEEPVQDRARVLAISGDLDASAAPAVKERLLASVAHGVPVVLDLTAVTYVDSPVLGAMFSARKEANITRENFAVVCEGEIRRLFEITGLDIAFDVVETRAEALEHLTGVV
jgi:anti-anti-sigma factor